MFHSSLDDPREDVKGLDFARLLSAQQAQKRRMLKEAAYQVYNAPRWRWRRLLQRLGIIKEPVMTYEKWKYVVDELFNVVRWE